MATLLEDLKWGLRRSALFVAPLIIITWPLYWLGIALKLRTDNASPMATAACFVAVGLTSGVVAGVLRAHLRSLPGHIAVGFTASATMALAMKIVEANELQAAMSWKAVASATEFALLYGAPIALATYFLWRIIERQLPP